MEVKTNEAGHPFYSLVRPRLPPEPSGRLIRADAEPRRPPSQPKHDRTIGRPNQAARTDGGGESTPSDQASHARANRPMYGGQQMPFDLIERGRPHKRPSDSLDGSLFFSHLQSCESR